MGPNDSKWWMCKDEMMVQYRERRMHGSSTRMHSLDWRNSCEVEHRGKEVHREAETMDGGRKRRRRQCGRSGKHERRWNALEREGSNRHRHLYDQKKKAARRVVDRARGIKEEELYRKIDKYGSKI